MTNEELDTLIAELEAHGDVWHKAAAKALADLRTERDAVSADLMMQLHERDRWFAERTHERDAALAVIEKARSIIPLPHVGQENGAALAREILATAPVSALADRDARILEEAADAIYDGWGGGHAYEGLARQEVEEELRARAASRRAEADNV